ncbi:MAG: AbrB/MazE/SpoVT family DNA-binding domain-containing protein [Candidatus Aenigmarchaeota archaeon]|nr:AbrB/MazE/SpoVT family DNA-binding domain-containing protein [Candidatus Aenigmarchaeota archaeon]
MGTTKVTRNYQVTLPKDVRELGRVHIGDRFIVTSENGEIVMKRIKGRIIERTFGSWKTKGSGVAYARKIRDEAEGREKRLGV